jgi:uncharacterized membrane protein
LWANLHLLFWLSIIPAATAWIGHNLLVPLPTAVYGVVLVMPAIAYYVLVQTIIHRHGRGSILAQAIGQDIKGKYRFCSCWSELLWRSLSRGLR